MNGHNETIEQRLNEMEVKLTFIDEAVQALTAADADQSQRIAALERALRDLRGELSSMRTASADDPHNEPPPPHY
jgi:SlyX protein